MNLSELITRVSVDADLSQAGAKRAVDAVIANITKTITKGDTMLLVGFGTFKTVKRAARPGRNPRTGEPADIPAHRAVKFTPSPKLKARVN